MAWAKDETTATFWHANGLSPSCSDVLVLQGWEQHPSSSLTAADDFHHPSMTLPVNEGKFKA
jgi:hypothetical protein